jgi:spermidine synthase
VLILSALAGLFLLSGFSALVYQIVWLRMLALVFGVTVHAASAVLTSFMGGLAIGSWLGGRLADRVRSPLAVFGLVEIGIGSSALVVPLALDAAQSLYAAIHSSAPEALPLLALARLLCSGLVLLIPTTLMGASLPLLSRYVAQRGGGSASRIGVLYAANTAGGILGTVMAGFLLIGGMGVTATTRVAVVINVTVGLIALAISLRRPMVHAATPEDAGAAGTAPPTRVQRTVLAVFALAGFAGLALEVVWFRVLVLFIPATTYAFTTMLATVLLGIAIGSAIGARVAAGSSDLTRALARVQIATGVLVILSMTALALAYRRGWATSGMFAPCVLAMLPATSLMGMTFPLGLAVWLRDAGRAVGTRVGILYAVNVCGAVAGALAGGFLVLPWLGSRTGLLVLAVVYVVAGCLLLTTRPRAEAMRAIAVSVVLWTVGALTLPDVYGAVLARRYGKGERVVFREEGVQTTTTVHYLPAGQRVLYLDGLHQANDSQAMVRVHAEIGHLPMLLHRNPERALVIGLGGGVTAGAVSAHRSARVDVVELADNVVRAASFFSHVNLDLLHRPNVRVRVDDGRNYLLLTPERYDVVTADIIQPIHAGAGNLYSREYFMLARGVLREGGLMMQWIGQREPEHYLLIMRTFLDVFPHATLWANGSLMVGSTAPLRISREAFERQIANPDVRFAVTRVGLDTFEGLRARYTAGPDEMRRFVGTGPMLTDDRPLLEYHRSLERGGRPLDISGLNGRIEQYIEPPF